MGLGSSTGRYVMRLCGCSRRYRKSTHYNVRVSDIAAAIAIHPYRSAEELLGAKVEKESEISISAKTLGTTSEGSALELYRTLRMDGCSVVSGANRLLISPSMSWLRGYADGLVVSPSQTIEGIVEIKTRFARDMDRAVPYQRLDDVFYYVPQCMAYMEMTGASYCDLMSYTKRGSNVFRIHFDAELFYLIRTALQQFRDQWMRDEKIEIDPRIVDAIRQKCINCRYEPNPFW